MKKIALLLCVLILFAGCGSKQSSQGQQAAEPESVASIHREMDPLVEQGMSYLNQGKAFEAIKSFDEAIRTNPRDSRAYKILGETYVRLRNFDKAVDTFTAALRVDPVNGEINYLLAIAHNFRGDNEKTIEYAQKSAVIFRKNGDERNYLRSLALLKEVGGPQDQ